MTNEELEDKRKKFINNLSNTVATVVHVDVGIISQLIGPEATDKAAIYINDLNSRSTRRKKPNSSIRPEKLNVKSGIAGFNRTELLKALQGGKQDTGSVKDSGTGNTAQSSSSSSVKLTPGSTSTRKPNSADPAVGS